MKIKLILKFQTPFVIELYKKLLSQMGFGTLKTSHEIMNEMKKCFNVYIICVPEHPNEHIQDITKSNQKINESIKIKELRGKKKKFEYIFLN